MFRFIIVFQVAYFAYGGLFVEPHWLLSPLAKRDGEITQERTKPIVVGDIVFGANLSGDVYAVHRTDGYLLWQKKFEAGIEGALSYGRSKLIVGDLQGTLYALNARDGSEAWRFKIQSEWLSQPLIFRDKVYVMTSSDELYALTESNGPRLVQQIEDLIRRHPIEDGFPRVVQIPSGTVIGAGTKPARAIAVRLRLD